MFCSKKKVAVALVSTLLMTTAAFAGDNPIEISQRITNGNPVAGKEKSTLCQGCHGEFGISSMPNIPNLAGQWGAYIMRELRDFWAGSRSDPIMTDMAGTVTSVEDAFDISAYFASQNQMKLTPHENEEGKRLYIIYRCISCHGEDGQGRPQNNAMFPVIGGQHKEYLVKQLDEFRTGLRETDMSGTMPILAKRMSAAETDAITDYLSGIKDAPIKETPVEKKPEPLPAAVPVVVVVVVAPIPEIWKTLLEDKPILIEGTNFVSNSADLKPIASKQLNGVVEFAKQNPDPAITVVGYTDSTGSEKRNAKLSLARAESVKQYLVNQGITANRIATKGESANNPIGDNKTIAGRAKNRRVEIRTVIKEVKKVLVKA
jgi:outer membrane protein OmpA-like peptidoglycan-associated protein